MSEIQGKIKVIGDIQTFGDKGFQKLEYVITTDEQYPQDIQLELHQDKCDLMKPFKVGDDIKTSINYRGKLWVNPQGVHKYFNTLVGWRIEKVETAPNVPLPPVQNTSNEEPDDLPF